MGNQQKLDRGKPLEELTKGSMNYTMRVIRDAFYKTFPDHHYEYFYIEEIFADHLIVCGEKLPSDEFYFVSYSRDAESESGYVFAPRSEWVVVELTYQPKGIEERLRESKGRKFNEVFNTAVTLSEAEAGSKTRTLYADGATADVVNGNRRRYREAVLREAVAEARKHLRESLSQGRAILLGEEDHPSDKGQTPKLTETIIKWVDLYLDAKKKVIKLKGEMIENIKGKDAIVTMEAGVLPGVSLRGYGESEWIEEDGQQIEEVLWLRFTGFDLVMNPSFETAAVTKFESRRLNMPPEDKKPIAESQTAVPQQPMTPEEAAVEAAKIRKDNPQLVVAIIEAEQDHKAREVAAKRKIEEARLADARKLAAEREVKLRQELGIDETADLETAVAERNTELKRLKESEQKRLVAEFLVKATDVKEYPEDLRKRFAEAVTLVEPQTIEEAKTAVAAQRKIFDGIAADIRMRQKGYGSGLVIGSVLEAEAGVPEFARGAFEIAEMMRARDIAKRRNLHKKADLYPSERAAVKVLARFDEMYRHQLQRESREFAEAETTTDLNLPYSAIRAIMEEAYPELIASQIFDVDVMVNSPARLYYEVQFAGESGYSNTVTGSNNVNATNFDTWYTLSAGHKRLAFAGHSMQPSGGGAAYEYGTDYVLDLINGRYMLLSTGSMATGTNYDLDYTYYATRKGENTEIERAKGQTAYITIEAVADRLATQITNEAVVFGRSQLGWDAVMGTINLLVKELRKNINRNLIDMGLAQALTIANNIGGTWNSATDSLQLLAQKILAAKVKIENRYYAADSIVMSKTNASKFVLWDGFTQAGARPGFSLNGAPGFVGELNGVPVWETTEIDDSMILVNNRQLVQYRIYQPMRLDGPHSVLSNGKLVGSREWYVEEYNTAATPISEKGSVVLVS